MECINNGQSPVNAREVKHWTDKDPLLSHVRHCIMTGTFNEPVGGKEDVCTEFKAYEKRKDELSVQDGCVLWGARIVIPPQGRQKIISELHESHPGISVMKAISRGYVWWPSLDEEIQKRVESCITCQVSRKMPPEAPLSLWEWPDRPWSRIHLDFAGPFMGKMFLIVVDAHTKWLEVEIMQSITSDVTIEKLRQMFARFGLPETIVSDNGATFTSSTFAEFANRNSIKHITSAPFKPASNGQAERAVQTFKNAMKKMTSGTLQTRLSRFLFTYRNSPHSTTGVSPATLMFKRELRVPLSLVHPNIKSRVVAKQNKQKSSHDLHAHERQFSEGNKVYVRNYLRGPEWLPGIIINKTGNVMFTVKLLDGRDVRKHVDQIRLRHTDERVGLDGSSSIELERPSGHTATLQGENTLASGDVQGTAHTDIGQDVPVAATPVLRRSERVPKSRNILDL